MNPICAFLFSIVPLLLRFTIPFSRRFDPLISRQGTFDDDFGRFGICRRAQNFESCSGRWRTMVVVAVAVVVYRVCDEGGGMRAGWLT
jgi:hypothetical protein